MKSFPDKRRASDEPRLVLSAQTVDLENPEGLEQALRILIALAARRWKREQENRINEHVEQQ